MKYVGEIEINEGLVDITDPCYDSDVWCRINNVKVKPGTYKCYADHNKKIGRILSSCIIHSDYVDELLDADNNLTCDPQKCLGTIGVDAGLAGYYPSPKRDYNQKEWQKFCDWSFKENVEHNPGNVENCFIHDGGFCTTSGYGDGGYGAFAYWRDGEFVALSLYFIGDEPEISDD